MYLCTDSHAIEVVLAKISCELKASSVEYKGVILLSRNLRKHTILTCKSVEYQLGVCWFESSLEQTF